MTSGFFSRRFSRLTPPEAESIPANTRTAKRGSCASGGIKGVEYNTPLHVAALFIILGTSTLACSFPILATNFPRLRIPPSFLFFVSHFGTGVLIATAFVHLLPTAFTSLGDPCLPEFWTTDYPAMPGAIALGGIFLVTVIEMVFSPSRHVCRGSPANNTHEVDSAPGPTREDAPTGTDAQPGHVQEVNAPAGMQDQPHIRDLGPLVGRSSSMSRAITRIGGDTDKPSEVAPAGVREDDSNGEGKVESVAVDKEKNDDGFGLTPEQKRKKEVMQVFLLEMGILFHSVFIGMSLSVTVGSEFVVLLIAIVFHRESLCYPPKTASADRFAQKPSKDSPWDLGSPHLIFPGTL
jgi:zinc transporter 1/2/3